MRINRNSQQKHLRRASTARNSQQILPDSHQNRSVSHHPEVDSQQKSGVRKMVGRLSYQADLDSHQTAGISMRIEVHLMRIVRDSHQKTGFVSLQ
jgi:hypothetical protein